MTETVRYFFWPKAPDAVTRFCGIVGTIYGKDGSSCLASYSLEATEVMEVEVSEDDAALIIGGRPWSTQSEDRGATLVVFRGRNTEAILADASSIPRDEVVVVCRDGDSMAKPGDVEASKFVRPEGRVILVANGGTTAQLVPVLLAVATGDFSVVDVQRDKAEWLAGKDKGTVVSRVQRLD